MVYDPEAKTDRPAHAVLAAVFQVRDGVLQVLLWERALEPFKGAWSLPGGALSEGETLESSIRRHLAAKVDVRELTHLEQLETLSEPARNQHSPTTRGGTGSTSSLRSHSTMRRSCSPHASGSEASFPTRTSASRSRPRPSRSPSSVRSTESPWVTRCPRRTCSACCCDGISSCQPERAANQAALAAAQPRSTRSACGGSRSPISSLCSARPTGERSSSSPDYSEPLTRCTSFHAAGSARPARYSLKTSPGTNG